MSSYHCLEYEELTIEEKLLVDKEMKGLFKKFNSQCVPTFIFKIGESRIIERLKEKEKDGRRKHRNANTKAGVVSRKRNESSRQRKA